MPIPSFCSGCGKSFTSSGYWSHLTQSKNPSCQAILEEQLIGVCSDSEDDLPSGDMCPTPADSSTSNFGQTGETDSTDRDDEDEDQRTIDHKLEMGWEPPRFIQDHGPLSSCKATVDDWDESEESDESDDYTSCRLSAEQRVQECTVRIIRYSLKYPHSHPGAVLSFAGPTADDRYSSSLGSHSNPWAPFASEIDWKVAHWAKTRGPGSTAFSDLLAINGVSATFFSWKSG